MDEKLAVLRSVPLFVGLDDSELKAVGGLTTEVDVPAGHELAREETFGDEFYMILDGNVRIHRAGSTIRTLGPGDFLGEIALIDHGRRTASATAETDCRLLVLGHREFHSLLDVQPDIRVHVLEALARRVRQLAPEHQV
ncbi:MAG TPA: cyclic nucleotide-binding domain-containing protein [Candidatus Limnocylindrales bacterium]|jgi:CRP-like cAMP-binding protein|nr:cyclic nucleotide-binding domain-containing protein [Candidatus Limnocylindrales bacterium]